MKGYEKINNQFEFDIKTFSFTFHSPTVVKHKSTQILAFA